MIAPSAVVVSEDLASAALGCTALARARKLAEWVGPGKELTSSGVLRPTAAAEACQVLGIGLPRARLRSALDVDELMRDWTAAADAGFLLMDNRRAWAAHDLVASPTPGRVLNAWVQAAARGIGVDDEPCGACIIVLHELYAGDGPLSLDELADAVAAVTQPDVADGEPCADCGQVHDRPVLLDIGDLIDDEDPGEDDPAKHAGGTVAVLVAFGAAEAAGSMVQLTPLGSMLARAVFEGCAPAPNADGGTLISAISEVPPRVAMTLARPWLAARPGDAAVAELLALAESAGGERRMAALALARELGPAAAAAWREWAGRPGFGAYARRWLADQGEPTAADPADEAWLAVDAFSIMLESLPAMLPPFLLTDLFQQEIGADAAEALSVLRRSGHPAAEGIVALLTGRPDPVPSRPGGISPRKARSSRDSRVPAGSPGGGVYQLKISLRGVSKPPVWRRVAVPAGMTLAELHEVILRAMGWDGYHLHVFSTGWAEYGTPSPDLGHSDDAAVRLADVLSGPGDTLRYTYDFGDDWEHDIQLEEILREEPGSSYPTCLAGKGTCPPEDCGGTWGYADLKNILADPGHEQHQDMLDWLGLDSGEAFDPKEFSVDEVNARLSHLTTGK